MNLENKIYVAIEHSGEYEDYRERILKAFKSEQDAEAFLDTVRIDNHRKHLDDWNEILHDLSIEVYKDVDEHTSDEELDRLDRIEFDRREESWKSFSKERNININRMEFEWEDIPWYTIKEVELC